MGRCVDDGDPLDVEVLLGADATIDGRVDECELVQSQPKAAGLMVQLSADVTQLIRLAPGVLRSVRGSDSGEAVRAAGCVRSEAVFLNHTCQCALSK